MVQHGGIFYTTSKYVFRSFRLMQNEHMMKLKNQTKCWMQIKPQKLCFVLRFPCIKAITFSIHSFVDTEASVRRAVKKFKAQKFSIFKLQRKHKTASAAPAVRLKHNMTWIRSVRERERERKLATSIININISYQKTENTIFPIFTHSDCLSSAPNGTAWCILIKTDWAKNNFVKNSESSKRFKRTSESDGMHTDNLSCYEMKLTFGGNHINLISFSLLKGFTTNWKIVFGFRRVRAVCLWCLSVAFDAVSMILLCANCKQRLE